MIDHETEFLAIKKACNNKFEKDTTVIGSECGGLFKLHQVQWYFNEDYVLGELAHNRLNPDDVELFRWHTPAVMDGGISIRATLRQLQNNDNFQELTITAINDGIVELGKADTISVQLERYRGRMHSISFDEKSCKFSLSRFDDPSFLVYMVQYFDYIANADIVTKVYARTKNDAKILAWAKSPYSNKPINPEQYTVTEECIYTPHTRAMLKISDDAYAQQMALCEAYDKENDA